MNVMLIQGIDLLRLSLALLPVLLFLVALRGLDSFKLVSIRTVILAMAAGAIAAGFCFSINSLVFREFAEYQDQYAQFGAPIVEEVAKAAYWILLIATARAAFMADWRSAVSRSAPDLPWLKMFLISTCSPVKAQASGFCGALELQ